MCVAIRSRNQRSCEITTAQPAKSSSASSSARSVSTSRSFVGSSSSSRLPPERSSFARWTRLRSPPERSPTFFCWSAPRKLNHETYWRELTSRGPSSIRSWPPEISFQTVLVRVEVAAATGRRRRAGPCRRRAARRRRAAPRRRSCGTASSCRRRSGRSPRRSRPAAARTRGPRRAAGRRSPSPTPSRLDDEVAEPRPGRDVDLDPVELDVAPLRRAAARTPGGAPSTSRAAPSATARTHSSSRCERALARRLLLLLVREPRLLLLEPAGVVALVRDPLAAVELEDPAGDVVEEVAVVGDGDDGARVVGEEALEPGDRLGVEVVRRLVEEQQVGRRQQQPAERDAAALAAGQRRDVAVAARAGAARPSRGRALVEVPGVVPRRSAPAPSPAPSSSASKSASRLGERGRDRR